MRSSSEWPGSWSRTRLVSRSMLMATWTTLTHLEVVRNRRDRAAWRPPARRSRRGRCRGAGRRASRRGRNAAIGVSAIRDGVERQDRAADREVVGRRAGRRRETRAPSPISSLRRSFPSMVILQLGGLVGLPRQEHLVDRAAFRHLAGGGGRLHDEGVDDGGEGHLEALAEVRRRASRSSGSRSSRGSSRRSAIFDFHEAVQRLEHQPVATQRDDHVGLALRSRSRRSPRGRRGWRPPPAIPTRGTRSSRNGSRAPRRRAWRFTLRVGVPRARLSGLNRPA